jgi:hypothetical protein
VEPGHAQRCVPGFYRRLVTVDPEDWPPAAAVYAAAGVLLYGADPNIIFDEEDDVRALAIGAAVELAIKMDKNRRQDLANRLGQVMSGE